MGTSSGFCSSRNGTRDTALFPPEKETTSIARNGSDAKERARASACFFSRWLTYGVGSSVSPTSRGSFASATRDGPHTHCVQRLRPPAPPPCGREQRARRRAQAGRRCHVRRR